MSLATRRDFHKAVRHLGPKGVIGAPNRAQSSPWVVGRARFGLFGILLNASVAVARPADADRWGAPSMSTQEQNAWMRQILNILIPSATPVPSSAPGPASARAADDLPADLPAQNTTADPSQPPTDAPVAAPPAGAQEIRDMIDDLDATMKQLQADGVPAEMLDVTKVTKFRAQYDAAIKSVGSPGQARTQTAALRQLKAAVATALKDLKADAERQATAMGSGAVDAIKDLRDAAEKLIDAMAVKDANDPKDPKTALSARLKALTEEIPDPAQIADKATLEAALKKADTDAKALLKDAAKAGGDNDPKVRQAVQDAYQKAIKEKYGISFGEGSHPKLAVKDTRLDDFYDVLEKVPVGHVAHKNMRDLTYVKGLDGMGKFTGCRHRNGNDAKGRRCAGGNRSERSEDDTGKQIRHHRAARTRPYGRLALGSDAGHPGRCQMWRLDRARLERARAAPDRGFSRQPCANHVDRNAASRRRASRVDPRKPQRPRPTVSVPPSGPRFPTIFNHGPTCTARDYPWIGDPVSYNGRSYVWGKWADGSPWFSYLPSARDQMHITPYQWSAPREWFAELYALCWHKNEPAPSFVHEKVQAFMPGGSAAATPKKS